MSRSRLKLAICFIATAAQLACGGAPSPLKPTECGGEPLLPGNVCCAGGVQGPACCERLGDPSCCGVVTIAPGSVCCTDGTQGTSCCGSTRLLAGNACCDDMHQGSGCCGPTGETIVLSAGNDCCADGTQGPTGTGISAACCGGTVRHPTYKCCLDGTQGLYCGADAWAGSWSGPVTMNCTNPFTSGLTYNIYVVSETSLLIYYIFGAGSGSAYANVSGSTAKSMDGGTTLTLNSSATPPTIFLQDPTNCRTATLTRTGAAH